MSKVDGEVIELVNSANNNFSKVSNEFMCNYLSKGTRKYELYSKVCNRDHNFYKDKEVFRGGLGSERKHGSKVSSMEGDLNSTRTRTQRASKARTALESASYSNRIDYSFLCS